MSEAEKDLLVAFERHSVEAIRGALEAGRLLLEAAGREVPPLERSEPLPAPEVGRPGA